MFSLVPGTWEFYVLEISKTVPCAVQNFPEKGYEVFFRPGGRYAVHAIIEEKTSIMDSIGEESVYIFFPLLIWADDSSS